ncbi:hypothetical protein P7K49_027165 [Saguinus oedipus]|uniref:Uncharacterized protein n=1 Tax=Saguinus oedipus TaxID=9490 RepID=A0ABQ9UF73_SAGOE|nr:hypothetical protein P7K49_027165 [Saguinus oedipus]
MSCFQWHCCIHPALPEQQPGTESRGFSGTPGLLGLTGALWLAGRRSFPVIISSQTEFPGASRSINHRMNEKPVCGNCRESWAQSHPSPVTPWLSLPRFLAPPPTLPPVLSDRTSWTSYQVSEEGCRSMSPHIPPTRARLSFCFPWDRTLSPGSGELRVFQDKPGARETTLRGCPFPQRFLPGSLTSGGAFVRLWCEALAQAYTLTVNEEEKTLCECSRSFDAPALGCLVPAPESSEGTPGLETLSSGSDVLRGLWILGLVSVPRPVFRDRPQHQRQLSPALTLLPGRRPMPSTGQEEGILRARVCYQGALGRSSWALPDSCSAEKFSWGKGAPCGWRDPAANTQRRSLQQPRSVLPPGGDRFYYTRPTRERSFSSVAQLLTTVQ